MKKNKTLRLASCLLIATLCSTCVISGTFAKYTEQVTGTDSARVAKWDIKYTDLDATQQDDITFDLFNTIKDSNGTDAETDVVKDLLAPGTSGSFSFTITNKSEVNADYTLVLTFAESGNVVDGNTIDIPVTYTIKKDSEGAVAIASPNGANTYNGDLDNVAGGVADTSTGTSVTYTIDWAWAFTGDAADTDSDGISDADEIDTILGELGAAQIQVTATITVTQVD